MPKTDNKNLCAIPLGEWVQLCRQGKCPPEALMGTVEDWDGFIRVLAKSGLLDPRSAERPGPCDIVSVFDKTIEVGPATFDDDGNVVPTERKLLKICAPMHLSLVVNKLRGLPANLTATESGEIVFPRAEASGFSPSYCLPFEPGDGGDEGSFYNIEHLILCGGAGVDMRGRNNNPYSPALFHIHAEIWGTC